MSVEPAPGGARKPWLGAGLILVLTLLAYLPAMHGGFIWDDDDYVSENRVLDSPDALRLIWAKGNTPQYYPVVFTSFWLEKQAWGLDPMGYHIVNILLHAANALLVWTILATLGFRGAWLVAAIFALHPVHVESVAWITERKNVLSGLFYLLSALVYVRFDTRREDGDSSPRTWLMYGGALALFAAALLSKTVTCSLPVALLLIMMYRRRRLTPARLLPLVPMLVLGLLLALQTAALERTKVGAYGPDFDFSFVERCLIASKALLFYPMKVIAPWPLMFIYPRWTIDAANPLTYWSIALVLAIGVAALVLYLRNVRGPGLALAFYAATIFPALGFVNVYPHLFSFVADHFQYLASLGIIALVVGGFVCVVGESGRQRLFASVPLVLCFMLTWIQSATYQSAETVWRDTLAKNPSAWMPHNNLASLLLKRAGRGLQAGQPPDLDLVAEAQLHAEAALALRPEHHTALANLSEALRLQGDLPGAAQRIGEAMTLRPHLWDYHYQLGRLLQLQEQFDGAIAKYEDALERV
ncbi:MAG: tetratricopeptide repeat protein, partial [Planctomycetota bacterium]